MKKVGYTYIMASKTKVLYTGFTSNLLSRVYKHKIKYYSGSFTERYNCSRLVYFEEMDRIVDAIARERQIKRWRKEAEAN